MDKKLARQHDQFLAFLSGAFIKENHIHHDEMIEYGKTMEISPIHTSVILDILVSDGFLEKRIIENKMDTDIIYSSKPEMTKFIYDDQGYKKKRTLGNYKEGNIKFTFIRNWFWLIGIIIIVLFNIFYIIKEFSN